MTSEDRPGKEFDMQSIRMDADKEKGLTRRQIILIVLVCALLVFLAYIYAKYFMIAGFT